MSPASAPLRIVFGCDTFAPDINGSASFLKRLSVALTERGHEVHVISPSPDRYHGSRLEVHDGVEFMVHRLRSVSWPPHPWFRFALPWFVSGPSRRVLASVDPDVVHFQSHINVGAHLAPVAHKAGKRLIGTNHTMPENVAQHVTIFPDVVVQQLIKWQWRSARKYFSMCEIVTSPTKSSADYFEQMTGLSGVYTISNGIDTQNYTPDFSPRTSNRIVFVGRLDEEKHIDELIEATARLDPALDVGVDIIGMGESRRHLEALAVKLGVADRVTFHGKLSDEDLRTILTAGTVFAMPSRAELQCIAAMEAMATALPVVAANAMALPHLVHPGQNGYLYEPGDIDGFVDGLTKVLTAPQDELDEMKRASQKIVAAHSLEHTVDMFVALYRGESVPLVADLPAAG